MKRVVRHRGFDGDCELGRRSHGEPPRAPRPRAEVGDAVGIEVQPDGANCTADGTTCTADGPDGTADADGIDGADVDVGDDEAEGRPRGALALGRANEAMPVVPVAIEPVARPRCAERKGPPWDLTQPRPQPQPQTQSRPRPRPRPRPLAEPARRGMAWEGGEGGAVGRRERWGEGVCAKGA